MIAAVVRTAEGGGGATRLLSPSSAAAAPGHATYRKGIWFEFQNRVAAKCGDASS